MADRIAPDGGYDFGNKRQYRRNVWNVFSRFCGLNAAGSQAFLMPSIEGDEIEVALSKGFKERNLSICDMNPAIVATLKRKYPHIQTYGVSASRAARRRASFGLKWDVANLDLCSCVGNSHYEELMAFALSGAVTCGIVSVSMLRGRERKDYFEEINIAKNVGVCDVTEHLNHNDILWSASDLPQGETDFGRIIVCSKALSGRTVDYVGSIFDRHNYVYISRWGKYRSTAGSQTMLWACYKIHSAPCICDLCVLSIRDNLRESDKSWTTQDVVASMRAYYNMSDDELGRITVERMASQPERRLISGQRDRASLRQAEARENN